VRKFMPYFVYKIIPPFKQLEQIQTFEGFKEASAFANLSASKKRKF